ncbi:hypothetical protein ACT80S_18325 [Ramlibacter sp. MAHUQ-53]|uniref:hypothetical protein n=1 Tax=unclassified Ramlibacter TaxID=2617605 RepID=UPI003633A516
MTQEPNNLAATVFVFRNQAGEIRCTYAEAFYCVDGRDGWQHIATLEPRLWIQAHYATVEKAEQAKPKRPSEFTDEQIDPDHMDLFDVSNILEGMA